MDKNKVSQILKQSYDISPDEIQLLKGGVENINYLVIIAKVKYVFRIYNKLHSIRGSRTKDSIELELEYVERARKQGIQVPQVINNKLGDRVTTIGDSKGYNRFTALYTFIDGKHIDEYTSRIAVEVAKTVNKFAEVDISFKTDQQMVTHDMLTRSIHQISKVENEGITIPKEVAALKEEILSVKEDIENSNLSLGLIHGDIKLGNILFDIDGKIAAVLDFDDYRHSYIIEEATMALMHDLHSDEENLLRSGNYEVYIENLTNPELQKDLRFLKYFIKASFVQDFAHYLRDERKSVIDEVLNDLEVKRLIFD